MTSVNHLPVFLEHFDLFVKHLKAISWKELPGLEAQLKMAPLIRREEISNLGHGLAPVKSSVLFLFFPMEHSRVGTVFIQRSVYRGTHSGQISFPGGRHERTDPDLEYTALRETFEEVGVPPGQVEVVGRMSNLFIPPSNFIVSPFLGISYQKPHFVPDPLEVAKIIEVELEAFFIPGNKVMKTIDLASGFSMQTPCFSINGYTIWGATAMMISEFLEIIRQ
ncbi:MAG: CoA pyrophosphatase [Bacteroidales bacterium]